MFRDKAKYFTHKDKDLDGLEYGAGLAAPQLLGLGEEHSEVEDDPAHHLRGARAGDEAVVQQPLHGIR